MEAVYAFGCELPPSVVEKMRETFAECEPYLDLQVSGQGNEQKNRTEAHKAIESISSEQLPKLLEFVNELTAAVESLAAQNLLLDSVQEKYVGMNC